MLPPLFIFMLQMYHSHVLSNIWKRYVYIHVHQSMFELLVEVIHIDTFHMNGNIFKHKSTLHVHNMSHFKSVLLYRYLLWFCTYLAMKPNGMFFITEVECLIIYVHLKYILSYISMVLYKAVKPMFLINSKVECIFMSPMKYIVYIYMLL